MELGEVYEYLPEDMVDGTEVQLPQHEQVNVPQPANVALVQLPFLDMTLEEELAWVEIEDPDDAILVDQFEAEMNPQPVPSDWRYWEHDENTLPAPDESNAPRVPSGWIDPVTGEEVP